MCLLVFCTYLFVVKSYTSHVGVRPSWLTPPTTTILPLWMTAPNMALGVFMAAISLHSDCLWLYENILFRALLWREGLIRSGHVPGATKNFRPQIFHFLLICLLLDPVGQTASHVTLESFGKQLISLLHSLVISFPSNTVNQSFV